MCTFECSGGFWDIEKSIKRQACSCDNIKNNTNPHIKTVIYPQTFLYQTNETLTNNKNLHKHHHAFPIHKTSNLFPVIRQIFFSPYTKALRKHHRANCYLVTRQKTSPLHKSSDLPLPKGFDFNLIFSDSLILFAIAMGRDYRQHKHTNTHCKA